MDLRRERGRLYDYDVVPMPQAAKPDSERTRFKEQSMIWDCSPSPSCMC
jgi:hypothetical protein